MMTQKAEEAVSPCPSCVSLEPATANSRNRDLGGIQPAQIELKVAKRIFCPQKRGGELWGLGFFVCLIVFLLWFGGFSLFFRLVGLGFSVIYSYDHISSASEKLNSTSQSIFEAKLSISRLQTKIIPKK